MRRQAATCCPSATEHFIVRRCFYSVLSRRQVRQAIRAAKRFQLAEKNKKPPQSQPQPALSLSPDETELSLHGRLAVAVGRKLPRIRKSFGTSAVSRQIRLCESSAPVTAPPRQPGFAGRVIHEDTRPSVRREGQALAGAESLAVLLLANSGHCSRVIRRRSALGGACASNARAIVTGGHRLMLGAVTPAN